MSRKKKSRAPRGDAGQGDGDGVSFVLDTQSADVPDSARPLHEPAAPAAPDAAGLALPSHVAIVQNPGAAPSGAEPGRMGDYEQLDAQGTRYYEAEADEERKRKGTCPVCGESGHDKKKCPYTQCLACGAVNEHATRNCPLGTSCFRCGGVGHRSKDCPVPRTSMPRSRLCERCGRPGHPDTTCPTLWRIYTYRSDAEYERERARLRRLELRRAARRAAHDAQRQKRQRSWAVSLVEPTDEAGPSESSSDDEDAQPPPGWDPVQLCCYNCARMGQHWGDDCPQRRTNPTRPTGEPSAFSVELADAGPFHRASPGLRLRGSSARPSLLDTMLGESDADARDWFARRQKLRQPVPYDDEPPSRPSAGPRAPGPLRRPRARDHGSRPRRARLPRFRPQYRGGYA
ncbi:hypothetical protein MCAP1_001474 [Malassezia caprae]|uniref:CCHC-type domain-containing protein n=1 Tax=Malassezia caprae TaxID=1381934 RepID=A0AAF0IV24_9BASI|nr:hypothetical protein MCAP1_001474 [Malassezia caprae]